MSSASFRTVVLMFCLVMALRANEVFAETARAAWPLIADGEALGVIYPTADATPTATYAAEELRDHLKLATGVELPIVRDMPLGEATPVVLVGPSDETARLGIAERSIPVPQDCGRMERPRIHPATAEKLGEQSSCRRMFLSKELNGRKISRQEN